MKGRLTLSLFKIILFLIVMVGTVLAKDSSEDGETIDISSIRDVIENDKLTSVVSEKNIELKRAQEEKNKREVAKYAFPIEEDFWQFLSEYWLVKNGKLLGWDVIRPDYGLAEAFKTMLENLGHYHQKFNILLIDSSEVCHFSFPSKKGNYVFVLSVPFIRTMNLSKLEISLLLFEDLIRKNLGFFQHHVTTAEFKNWVGKNYFAKKKVDEMLIPKILENYDNLIFKKGFSFQEQFEVTKVVFSNIEKDDSLVLAYKNLLHKIDALVKTNERFKNYVKIYPSPELQLGWIGSVKKSL